MNNQTLSSVLLAEGWVKVEIEGPSIIVRVYLAINKPVFPKVTYILLKLIIYFAQ